MLLMVVGKVDTKIEYKAQKKRNIDSNGIGCAPRYTNMKNMSNEKKRKRIGTKRK